MSVDELCRSYLDLKYHFDPAAGSAAGLVAHDDRLGRFDPGTVREHVAALRAVAGAVEALDVDDLQEEIDRTALLGEIRSHIFRLEHERPHVRNPVFWVNHLFQGLYAVLSRTGESAVGRGPAALARLRAVPAFLDSARTTLDEPPSVFVESALAMLGGGGELIVQTAATIGAEAPELQADLAAAAGAALEALKRCGAPRRGRARRRSARLRHRGGAVRPAPPFRARDRRGRARAVALRPASAGRDHRPARGARRGAQSAAVARGGGRAQE
jgi:hypothetical protein